MITKKKIKSIIKKIEKGDGCAYQLSAVEKNFITYIAELESRIKKLEEQITNCEHFGCNQ
jgi:hypothetical protein